MKSMKHLFPGVFFFAALILMLGSTASAEWKEKVLYSFQGGSDGATPAGGVVFDTHGNLYGATTDGGSTNCPGFFPCGTVFELTPSGQGWSETVLYVFQGKQAGDGSTPGGSVVIDKAGNLYGTTAYGGAGHCQLLGVLVGCGTVYELKQAGGGWTETVLYSFQGGKDGYLPNGDLTWDAAGNLYGATAYGGGKGTTCNKLYGGQCGTVFRLSPPQTKGGNWTEVVLHGFAGISSGNLYGDGAVPNGGLLLDSEGAVYGTTFNGGYNCPHNSNQGCGTVFQLRPQIQNRKAWAERVLHRFNPGKSDGDLPMAGVIKDAKEGLYGTTHGDTVFRLTPSSKKFGPWNETVLYGFNGKGASYALDAPVIFDSVGNLYSTAYAGSGGSVDGNVFRLGRPGGQLKPWTIDVLYSFRGSPDGALPAAGLIFDKNGSLYSTTQSGGNGHSCQDGCGTVFEVSP